MTLREEIELLTQVAIQRPLQRPEVVLRAGQGSINCSSLREPCQFSKGLDPSVCLTPESWQEEPEGHRAAGRGWAFSYCPRAHASIWNRKWQPTPVFLPGKFQGQRNLVGCKESDMTERSSHPRITHTHTHTRTHAHAHAHTHARAHTHRYAFPYNSIGPKGMAILVCLGRLAFISFIHW